MILQAINCSTCIVSNFRVSHSVLREYFQENFFLFSAEQEQREFEAISHVRDSVQMVENAILERDQVCMKLKQP